MMRRGDVEPLVGTPGWVGYEVRKGFMEGLNRVIDVLLEDK
jgi:hypothetical protein